MNKLEPADLAQTLHLREDCDNLTAKINLAKNTTSTRERSLALTKVEEAAFWLQKELDYSRK